MEETLAHRRKHTIRDLRMVAPNSTKTVIKRSGVYYQLPDVHYEDIKKDFPRLYLDLKAVK